MVNTSRLGLVKNKENPVTRRRRYRIHYNLKKLGNKVNCRTKTVIVRDGATLKEREWTSELLSFDYAIQNQEIWQQ